MRLILFPPSLTYISPLSSPLSLSLSLLPKVTDCTVQVSYPPWSPSPLLSFTFGEFVYMDSLPPGPRPDARCHPLVV